MKMNKVMVSIFILLLTSMAVSAYSKGSITDLTNIKVSFIGNKPDPAEPGTVIDVRWKVENIGGDTANDLIFKIVEKYPFSVYTGSAERDLGTISARQTGDEGVIVRYQILVDKDAKDGESEIEIMYKYSNSVDFTGWIKYDPDKFKIKIQSPSAILGISDVKTEPATVAPGEKTKLSIYLQNNANSLIENIKIKLNLNDVPFSPIGSSNQKSLQKLDSDENKIISFELLSDASASSKVYKIPIIIEYSDKLRKNYTESNVVSVFVNQQPEWYAIIDSSSVYVPKTKGDVSIKFVNNGPVDIKFLNVDLAENGDYIIISSKEQYVGNIDSDDYETADFSIFINPTKKKELILPLKVDYMDANNNKYSEEIMLNLPVYSTSEAKKLGLIAGSSKIGFLIIILIVGAGIFWYIRRRRRHKKLLAK